MHKHTKMWIGVAVVAAVAYYFWEKSKTDAASDAAKAAAAAAPAAAPAAKFVGFTKITSTGQQKH